MTRAEITSTLEEVATLRQEATAARVPDEAFAELDARVEEAREASQRVTDMLEHGDVIDAQKAATELKARVAPLPEAYRQARDRWQAEHPRPVRRKR